MHNRRTFLTAEWRYLLMINWIVDPALLVQRVPPGTELDTFQNQHYLSLVGFRFLRTRVLGLPIPMHMNFDEINLRFYVRRREGATFKRGVVFVREIVPRGAIAAIARLCYNEPYVAMPTRHEISTQPYLRVRYAWKLHNTWNSIEASTSGQPAPLTEASEEQFITEHYWGFTTQRNGRTKEYQVVHPSWNVWQATSRRISVDFSAIYGSAFAEALSRPPDNVLIADGSPIKVSRGLHLRD